jgi:hypothetical protein
VHVVPRGDNPSHFYRVVAGERGLLTHNMSKVLVQQAERRAWQATASKDLLPACWERLQASLQELHAKLEPASLPATMQAARERLRAEAAERQRQEQQQREEMLASSPYLKLMFRGAGGPPPARLCRPDSAACPAAPWPSWLPSCLPCLRPPWPN